MKENASPEDVLARVWQKFGSKPAKEHTKITCLLCGRVTVRAKRIHTSCEKRNPEGARAALDGFFKVGR